MGETVSRLRPALRAPLIWRATLRITVSTQASKNCSMGWTSGLQGVRTPYRAEVYHSGEEPEDSAV